MNVYFDTSAFVPLLIAEPGRDAYKELWRRTERAGSTRLMFIEATSTLTRARRARRISNEALSAALGRLEQLWRAMFVVELNQPLMLEAAILAGKYGLRGFDAVHCAAAFRMEGLETIGASGDKRLREARSSQGLATYDARA